ncbi:MAG: PIN domain-containing protein [Isosphaeraceae bacterium]
MIAVTSSSVALVDTNILVYAYDPGELSKHTVARELIQNLSNDGRLPFSIQVLNEFCAVMMRPNRTPPLTPAELVDVIRELEAISQVVPVTAALTRRALKAMPGHAMSFWDALIWPAAVENAAAIIYTEDFQDGREVDGVRFVNPFSPGAQLQGT